jgi:hypothetical protein
VHDRSVGPGTVGLRPLAAKVTAMSNQPIPELTVRTPQVHTSFQQWVDESPYGRFIGDRWRSDPMRLMVVDSRADWDAVPAAVTESFTHCHSEHVLWPGGAFETWCLWLPQLAADLLADHLDDADTEHEITDLSTPVFDPLRKLAPDVMCTRVLETHLAFRDERLNAYESRVLAAHLVAAASRHLIEFRTLLELAPPAAEATPLRIDALCAVLA